MNRITKAKLLISSALAVAITVPLTAYPASASDAPRRTILAVDTSGSSTFIADQPSADAAARYVERYIAGLAPPHELRMISVGETGMAKRTIDIRATVTDRRASSPKRVAAEFGGYFRALPTAGIRVSGSTSLIAFFESLEPVCSAGPTAIIVFTDGLEFSSQIDGRAFARGAIDLPKPGSAFLAGCRIEMLGIGQLRGTANADGLEARLIPQWRKFLEAAGADAVVVTGGFFDF